ncbi:hypothetical protein CTheo_949 [Ceratobasidium theobromae]|uniref:Uncharacterized protein n=1 Tax=Ceratobasidium theobromae TaxID=1582974 RepID=A0A5N5QVU8_9AGAM|nr:hypothetical protein CTheo_949 [Ceratobasidium theobromae]
MPPASLRRTGSNSPRHAPIPKDSRAARAARRERVVLAEIELWRSVAGQTSTPSRTPSEGSFVDENGSVAGSVGTEDDADEAPEPVEEDERSEAPSRRRRPLRPAQQPTSTRTLRPLASRTLSFAGFPVPTVAPEIRSLELDVSHLAIVDAPVRPPSTPRRRSTRLRL